MNNPAPRRRLLKIAGILAGIYLALLGALLAIMRRPTVFGKVMARVPEAILTVVPFKQLWFIARTGRLALGDAAPDFFLSSADKKSRLKLSSFHGEKPVVLVFGSYT